MNNRTIHCAQCENEFDFTVSEQIYFTRMGFDEPKRCPDCRKHKIRADIAPGFRMNRNRKMRQRREDDFE